MYETCCISLVYTHIEPGGGKVKARVHAFDWEIGRAKSNIDSPIRKPKTDENRDRGTERQRNSLCNASF